MLVPQALIGTHENVIKSVSNIDFSRGWNGPAIAVGGYTDRLFNSLKSKASILRELDYGELGVLDGHHRLAAARGLLSLVPVQIFPLKDRRLRIGAWKDGDTPFNRAKVVSYFKNKQIHAPAKSTKFQVLGVDKNWYRIANIQPRVQVGHESLVTD